MREDFLHFIWKNRIYKQLEMADSLGRSLEIIDPGIPNYDSGPDFFNAKIKIEEMVWAGNVEIHLNGDDWYRHRHHKNSAYNNVILHVVLTPSSDGAITNEGRKIPEFIPEISHDTMKRYHEILEKNGRNQCLCVPGNDSFFIESYIERLAVERLEAKCEYVSEINNAVNGDHHELLFRLLMRSMGMGINSIPFEMEARSIRSTRLYHHRDNLLQLEALLFGQAGFLDELLNEDHYYNELRREYLHLANKYNLSPISKHIWKFAKLRPANFPTIRLAQMAAFLHSGNELSDIILSASGTKSIIKIFQSEVSEYWLNHYQFNHVSPKKAKQLGDNAASAIIINAVVPYLFFLGKEQRNTFLCDKALLFLEELPIEENNILRSWKSRGVEVTSAFGSQALIHLSKVYCEKKDCLQCRIGQRFLSETESINR